MKSMKRRQAFQRLALALTGMWASLSCRHLKPAEGERSKIERDLDLLSRRKYSEEGIPMLLVCSDVTVHQRPPRFSTDSARFAAALRENAELLAQLRTPGGEDLAKLVELIAERDFGRLSTRAR